MIEKYFARDFTGPPFELLGTGHVIALFLFSLPYLPFASADSRSSV